MTQPLYIEHSISERPMIEIANFPSHNSLHEPLHELPSTPSQTYIPMGTMLQQIMGVVLINKRQQILFS